MRRQGAAQLSSATEPEQAEQGCTGDARYELFTYTLAALIVLLRGNWHMFYGIARLPRTEAGDQGSPAGDPLPYVDRSRSAQLRIAAAAADTKALAAPPGLYAWRN